MSWWGKVIGGGLGFMLGGPLGMLLGLVIGHNVDEKQGLNWGNLGGSGERVQAAFFTATFSVMGHISKADGRVSETEIQMARAVMNHMNITGAQKEAAIRLFNEGKDPGFPLQGVMNQFRNECHGRRDLFRMFMEIQLQAAMADGDISAAEREVLEKVCGYLGIPNWELRQLEALIRAARNRAQGGAGYQRRHESGSSVNRARDSLKESYEILGVTRDATDAEVKKAYRKLMSQHHPDKLAAKGLPEEMMKLAQEKAKDITLAYDTVKEARGMK
ncbi:MAG: co-chaperone DjlA [Gammaproteobacteria bacterium]|nr:co-chaperone DjlA [Gammaproteobacteria bacterium]